MTTKRNLLIHLGADSLADALLELAAYSDEAAELVSRLAATADEKVYRFNNRIKELERSGNFYDWRQVAAFGRELEGLLEDVADSVRDSRTGVELMIKFFKSDSYIFESCDDSSGEIGGIFQDTATGIFSQFATGCSDKQWLRNELVSLLEEDGYGVRDFLLDSVNEYMPTEEINLLIDQLRDQADKESSTNRQRSWYRYIEQLAEQIGDAQLFEEMRRKSWGSLNSRACLDIGRMYFQAGDPQTALAWLERIDDDDFFQKGKRDQLLRSIYDQLGDMDKLKETTWKSFRGYRSLDGLEELLEVIGQGQREMVITQAKDEILSQEKFSSTDALFLIQTGQAEAAERYLLQYAQQFDGDCYFDLLPLAEFMEENGRYLAATMVYRALLNSILRRGYTKSYHHGISYLQRLDFLSSQINNWQRFMPHEQYKQELQNAHGRKYSFWGNYGGEKKGRRS